MKILRLVLPLLLVAFGISIQQASPSSATIDVLDQKIPDLDVKDVTFSQSLSELSRKHVQGMHIGFEEILRERVSDPDPPQPRFTLSLRGNTLRQVLGTICSYDARYTWARDGQTVNVYPKEVVDDNSYLLNRRLDQITVTDIPDPGEGLTFLDRQLPPPREQLAYAGAGGDFSYTAPWTHTFDHVTVRQFMNRLSEHMGSHTSWLFYGTKQERLFTFLKGGFH